MVIEIAAVCLIAKLRRLRLGYLWRTWTFYPILLAQCVLIASQVTIFLRIYTLVPLSSYLEMAVILSFLFAMLQFRLYRPAVLGSAAIVAGTVLNKIAIAQNGGHMPVFPSLSYLTGYITRDMFGAADQLHVLGGAATKLPFLTDYIDYGYSVLSPGDVLIHLYACMLFYALIRAVNERYGSPVQN